MEFLNTPYFGIVLSILFFELGLYIYKKSKLSFLNPLLISITGVVIFLMIFNIDTAYYNRGGDLILFFLGPATVILAVPLYKQRALLKAHFLPILIGVTVGCITAIVSVVLLAKAFDITEILTASLVPKSVTTPIGVEISSALGGVPGITVGAIIVAGIFGAVIAPTLCRTFRIKDRVAIGIAIGTAAHAAGTTRAIEMGETEGAMSGLAIGIAGLITVLLVPVIIAIL
ncbi:TIGR00659 family protein [Natronincola peptidivorans]|uniref:TIGR00659 family protein n=1 Tax=Natronincola peptidivorans TaxID=426128 RepID=A0A1I0APM4_9FIRM|nr:LrgB family protein [Natronincola peptidivorans]SES95715.1 TIGR00659 family protein [Natronincola peptidivorans]